MWDGWSCLTLTITTCREAEGPLLIGFSEIKFDHWERFVIFWRFIYKFLLDLFFGADSFRPIKISVVQREKEVSEDLKSVSGWDSRTGGSWTNTSKRSTCRIDVKLSSVTSRRNRLDKEEILFWIFISSERQLAWYELAKDKTRAERRRNEYWIHIHPVVGMNTSPNECWCFSMSAACVNTQLASNEIAIKA